MDVIRVVFVENMSLSFICVWGSCIFFVLHDVFYVTAQYIAEHIFRPSVGTRLISKNQSNEKLQKSTYTMLNNTHMYVNIIFGVILCLMLNYQKNI